jgi:hypothetical protein
MTTSLYARWKPGRGQSRFCAREKDAGLKPGATLIFAIGHTLGTAAPKVTYRPQEAAVFDAMQGFRFPNAPLRMTTKKEMRRPHIKAFAG